MKHLAYLFGILSGIGLTMQVGMNTQLRRDLDSANAAALVSFLVGTFTLVVIVLVTRTPIPTRGEFGQVPMWAWFGGMLGAFYVAMSTVVATQIGAAALLGLVLVGQLTGALVLDHFGWLGLPQNPITFARLAGVFFLGVGCWLVAR